MQPVVFEDGLKHRAYFEATRLQKGGYDHEVIFARLEKQGIPKELIMQVIKNVSIQQTKENKKQQDPFFNIALVRIGFGTILAVITAIVVPGIIILPISLVAGGIAAAYMSRSEK